MLLYVIWTFFLCCLLFFLSCAPLSSVSTEAVFSNVTTVLIISKPPGTVTWFLQEQQKCVFKSRSARRRSHGIHTQSLIYTQTHCLGVTHLDAGVLPNEAAGLFRFQLLRNENYQTENSFKIKTQALLPQHMFKTEDLQHLYLISFTAFFLVFFLHFAVLIEINVTLCLCIATGHVRVW